MYIELGPEPEPLFTADWKVPAPFPKRTAVISNVVVHDQVRFAVPVEIGCGHGVRIRPEGKVQSGLKAPSPLPMNTLGTPRKPTATGPTADPQVE